MLLRLRVRLPDRPGSLGQVARTLGVTGADIVQMVVLERIGGRAVDDFTVIWPAAAPVDRILAGLSAIPGVAIEGVWRSVGAPTLGGADAELVGQVAANPTDGIATLVDAVPGLLSADWSAVLAVPADWARAGEETSGPGESLPTVVYASWRAPQPLRAPEVTPLRPRAFDGPNPVRAADGPNPVRAADGPDTVRYAAAPFGRAGLVLLVARGSGAGTEAALPAPRFHVTEIDRLAQLVRASALVLSNRLDQLAASASGPSHRGAPWPVNDAGRLAAALDN